MSDIGKQSESRSKMSSQGVFKSCYLMAKMEFKAGHCYWNCMKVLELDEYHDAVYVEGIAVKPEKIIHAHGWLEIDAELIDPTQPTAELVYFPALRFQGLCGVKQAATIMCNASTYQDALPFYKHYGRNGEKSHRFVSAIDEAVREFGHCTPYDPADEL